MFLLNDMSVFKMNNFIILHSLRMKLNIAIIL